MILYSETKLNLIMNNVLAFDLDDGVLYVSSKVYRDAILLADRCNDVNGVWGVLGSKPKNKSAMITFSLSAPDELKVLGAFFTIIEQTIPDDVTMKELYGILHGLSMLIGFNEFSLVKFPLRQDAVFTAAMIGDYEKSWEQLKANLEVRPNSRDVELSVISDKLDTLCSLVGNVAELLSKKEENSQEKVNEALIAALTAIPVALASSGAPTVLAQPIVQATPVITTQAVVTAELSNNSTVGNNTATDNDKSEDYVGDASEFSDFFADLFNEISEAEETEKAAEADKKAEKQKAIDEAIATGDLSKIKFDSKDDMTTALVKLYS